MMDARVTTYTYTEEDEQKFLDNWNKKHHGDSVWRVVDGEQVHVGRINMGIGRDDLQAGDLVFYSDRWVSLKQHAVILLEDWYDRDCIESIDRDHERVKAVLEFARKRDGRES
jgi:hypothetical protein